jgi:hypothetical protein
MQAQHTCRFCGGAFERTRVIGRPQVYCSVDCRTAHSNARRSVGTADTSWPRSEETEIAVCAEYVSGLSVQSVADKHRVARGTVERVLIRNGVARRKNTASTARKRFKNGRVRHYSGYIWVMIEHDDPLRSMASRGSGWQNGYAQEHRIVMARHIGRPLLASESVHHVNGLRDDNRIENLELWVKAHGAGQRADDLVAFVCTNYPEAVDAFRAGRSQLRLIEESK